MFWCPGCTRHIDHVKSALATVSRKLFLIAIILVRPKYLKSILLCGKLVQSICRIVKKKGENSELPMIFSLTSCSHHLPEYPSVLILCHGNKSMVISLDFSQVYVLFVVNSSSCYLFQGLSKVAQGNNKKISGCLALFSS